MQRLIIDTDPGVDDAQAILLASAHPETKIEAILTVGGNVGLEHTTRNALSIVEAIGQDIPVYEGCDGPLVLFGEDAAWVHGSDGLGDSGITPQVRKASAMVGSTIQLEPQRAADQTLATITPKVTKTKPKARVWWPTWSSFVGVVSGFAPSRSSRPVRAANPSRTT